MWAGAKLKAVLIGSSLTPGSAGTLMQASIKLDFQGNRTLFLIYKLILHQLLLMHGPHPQDYLGLMTAPSESSNVVIVRDNQNKPWFIHLNHVTLKCSQSCSLKDLEKGLASINFSQGSLTELTSTNNDTLKQHTCTKYLQDLSRCQKPIPRWCLQKRWVRNFRWLNR